MPNYRIRNPDREAYRIGAEPGEASRQAALDWLAGLGQYGHEWHGDQLSIIAPGLVYEANYGDWLVQTPNGLIAMSPAAFDATYEPA